jgi:acetyltransferase
MSLQSFFNPKAIALVGASTNPEKIGRQILDNILLGGFKGKVFPINLKEKKIAGLLVYNDLSKIPKEQRKDLLVIIAIPADFVLEEILKCATLGIKNIIIISSGFKESGDRGDKLEKEIISLASKYNLNILGPNCLGLINTCHHLNAAFAVSELRAGRIALLSQSGAIGSAALDWVKEKGIGLSHFISLGNKAVLSENEIIAYLAKDKQTDVVVIYLESIKDGKKLMNLVSNLSPVKPVLILKAGQSSVGRN